MLPASNRGVGMNMCFPDVCLTPAPPAPPIPVPYPNIGMNAQAQGFVPNVKISGMNALNMGTKISMTSGDEAGAAHPTMKGAGGYSMGSPKITLNNLPAIHLTCLANGNNMNAPMGAVLVPSAVNVLFTDLARADALRGDQTALSAGSVLALDAVARGGAGPVVCASLLDDTVGLIALRAIPDEAATLWFRAARALDARGACAWMLDLRGNGGGDLSAALALAGVFLPEGTVVAQRIEPDGDATPLCTSDEHPDTRPLVVLVDPRTASAAEVLAGALQQHRRARLVGARTYGKGSIQTLLTDASGPARYASVGECTLPDGAPIEGRGLTPDLECDPDDAVATALEALRRGL